MHSVFRIGMHRQMSYEIMSLPRPSKLTTSPSALCRNERGSYRVLVNRNRTIDKVSGTQLYNDSETNEIQQHDKLKFVFHIPFPFCSLWIL